MDVRLVQLLGSFIGARSQYALVRLECALHAPELPSLPLIDRLSDASESTLRDEWPAVERQLDAALAYWKHLTSSRGKKYRDDAAFRALEQALRELDQYARAIRWVLTVTENEEST
jgi:hypothetical protein